MCALSNPRIGSGNWMVANNTVKGPWKEAVVVPSKILWPFVGSIGRKSQLSLENKFLVYKVILKPVWTYGIQLWGSASNSNLEILERFQSKVLRIITDAPRYVPNTIIKSDLQIPTVKHEARKYSAKYRKRLDTHPNNPANTLFKEQFGTRRLKRLYPTDLVTNR